jgi:polyferredoxin
LGFFDIWRLPKIWVSGLFCLAGLIMLIKAWVTRTVRMISLAIVFFSFGILSALPIGEWVKSMSMHPSALCMLEKPFIFVSKGRAVPVFFLSIIASVVVLSILGSKLFCGWVCPVGALQELVHMIPLKKGMKGKVPFRISNGVRIGFFALFIVLLFAAGISLYEYANPFEFFHFGWGWIAIVALVIVVIAALFLFRPFCYFLCPLGLLTWLAEHIAIFKVRLDKDKCTDCKICVKESPCPTVQSILDDAEARPDCHPCGRCIEVCPEKALKFRTGIKK